MSCVIDTWDRHGTWSFLTDVDSEYRDLATDSQLEQLRNTTWHIYQLLKTQYAEHKGELNSFSVSYVDTDLILESAYRCGRIVLWFDEVPEDSLLVIVDGRSGDMSDWETINMDIDDDTIPNVSDTVCRYCIAFAERETVE